MSTIIIRGSTDNIMDDIERAIDDGVNSVKVLTRDQRCLPGAAATEIELAKQLMTFGEQVRLAKCILTIYIFLESPYYDSSITIIGKRGANKFLHKSLGQIHFVHLIVNALLLRFVT